MISHSLYSPSRLHRIMACPGSVRLIEANGIASEPSKYADHGTMLHKYTHDYLTGTDKLHELEAKEDKFLVMECVDYFNDVIRSKSTHKIIANYESEVSLASWGIPEVYGTLDASIVDLTSMHLDIFDWKFGSGVQVFAKENPQQLAYAAGVIGYPQKYPVWTVSLHIVQPAFEHFDVYELDVNELYQWVHGDLATCIVQSKQDPPIFNPGKEQCRFCEAAKKGKCDFMHAKAHQDAIAIFENAKLKATITPQQIQEYLELFPLVEQVAKGYMMFIQEELARGSKDFDHFKLVRGRANRSWINETETVKWLSEHTKIEDMFTSKLFSPSQIEKLDKNLKKNIQFQKLYEKPEGKVKLAPATDPRPAVDATKCAADAFDNAEFPDELE